MDKKLQLLDQAGLLRELKPLRQKGVHVFFDNQEYLNFSSNDYLGISGDIGLQMEFFDAKYHFFF